MPYAKPNLEQEVLFGEQEAWREEWQGMPEFEQKNLLPEYSVRVNFASYEDLQRFAFMVSQTISIKTQSIWFPKQERETLANKKYVE
jgi:hypothetical protein